MFAVRSAIFQSTLPRRERPLTVRWRKSCTIRFQSTLPRRERPYRSKVHTHQKAFQSTLPRRERQACSVHTEQQFCISIHAPAKGATEPTMGITYGVWDFNPRSREGSDIPATLGTADGNHFNPRSREGSDRRAFTGDLSAVQFQSTLPRRERPVDDIKHCRRSNFNPRSREGSDSPHRFK